MKVLIYIAGYDVFKLRQKLKCGQCFSLFSSGKRLDVTDVNDLFSYLAYTKTLL